MIAILISFAIFTSVFSDENILCTTKSCKDVVCPKLSEKCKAQNATHNGVFLLSPITCNCCEFCLDNLNEGEECSKGDVTDPVPKEVCGPGLVCKTNNKDSTDGVCAKMETACTNLQKSYDERGINGTAGTLEVRQDCTSEGEFVPYKCIPGQTCYCVNATGHRIFGEMDFTPLADDLLKCKCSRDYTGIAVVLGRNENATLEPLEHFRCTANGDYDSVQCINDKCFCVDEYDGAPTYPNDKLVNITDISKSTLKCYKNKKAGVFYKDCENEYIDVLKMYNKFKKNDYKKLYGFKFPKCDLDGTYQAVQENSTHKYCVDKEGHVLTSAVVDKGKDSDLAKSMDCKCARARLIITGEDKPECMENGNYAQVQCRKGRCRCVDSDGNQVCDDVNCEVDEKNSPPTCPDPDSSS
ncbi:unnamed protein product [Phyllotreta striolata]|uniref:Thyroglobulin type-1 domain-containing protein n=1 Tax=Phyllotreta striolata TaxID=444603 RepID=A0A9N9TTQ2_PHYSR|nr:unnamed protein product [Phyllotreta striolata]